MGNGESEMKKRNGEWERRMGIKKIILLGKIFLLDQNSFVNTCKKIFI